MELRYTLRLGKLKIDLVPGLRNTFSKMSFKVENQVLEIEISSKYLA